MKARESHGRAAPWGPLGLFNEAGLLHVGLAGTSIRTGKLKRKTIIRDNCLCPNIKAPSLPFYLSLSFFGPPHPPPPHHHHHYYIHTYPLPSPSLSLLVVYRVQREKHTPVLTAGQANIICDSWTETSLNKTEKKKRGVWVRDCGAEEGRGWRNVEREWIIETKERGQKICYSCRVSYASKSLESRPN